MRSRRTPARMAPPAVAANDTPAPKAVDLGPLSEFIGYRLRRAQLSVFAGFELALRELGLSPGELSVLIVISRNPGLTQSDVCGALGIQRANFTPLLHELEAQGLAVREVLPADRRSNTLRLTAKGRDALTRALALHERLEQRIGARLGQADRAQLIELLHKLETL